MEAGGGHWGATHRSCASRVKPPWPLPAVPLLEHAAPCKELLEGWEDRHPSCWARHPEQDRERRMHRFILEGADGKEALGLRTGAQPRRSPLHLPQEPHLQNYLLLWTELLPQIPAWEP